MKRLIILLVILGLVVNAGVAVAAPTAVKSGNVIVITPDGTTNDWDSTVLYPNGMYIYAIAFCSSGANDKLSLRNGSATAAQMFPYLADAAASGQTWYYGDANFKPYLKASECTFGTAANARIILIFK